MPWKPSSAKRHTKKATSSKAKRQWSKVANTPPLAGRSSRKSSGSARER